jgi:hypothetical protein
MENPVHLHPLERWRGQIVVLDTPGPLVYIGTLTDIHAEVLILQEADVHDTRDSGSTKEYYIAQSRELGVRPNRTVVVVRRDIVASVSLLEDVRM